jgi:hypothetical protein
MDIAAPCLGCRYERVVRKRAYEECARRLRLARVRDNRSGIVVVLWRSFPHLALVLTVGFEPTLAAV